MVGHSQRGIKCATHSNLSYGSKLLTKLLSATGMSHAEYRLLLRNRVLIGVLAMAELALGLVRLERGALTEPLVAEVAHVRALPGMRPEKTSLKCGDEGLHFKVNQKCEQFSIIQHCRWMEY